MVFGYNDPSVIIAVWENEQTKAIYLKLCPYQTHLTSKKTIAKTVGLRETQDEAREAIALARAFPSEDCGSDEVTMSRRPATRAMFRCRKIITTLIARVRGEAAIRRDSKNGREQAPARPQERSDQQNIICGLAQ